MRKPSVPEELMPSVYAGVGMVVMNWTMVENCLDYWSAIAFQDHGGNTIEPELPRQFKRKVRFLRKAFNRLPGLASFKDEALKHVERIDALSEIRHYATHGVLTDFDQEDNETFVFIKVDVSDDKTEHVTGELRLPGARLIAAGVELIQIAAACQKLTTRILDALEPQDMDD